MIKTPQRGFTLIEMMVSVAIFSIVMTIATGAYLSLINLDRRARATNEVVTNLSYAIEDMSRSLRTGTNYSCAGAGDCASPRNSISFIDDQARHVTYLLKTDGTIGECTADPCNTTNATSITDPRITISSMNFFVLGSAPLSAGDARQPRAIFSLQGSIRPDPKSAPIVFTIESSATERLIDL